MRSKFLFFLLIPFFFSTVLAEQLVEIYGEYRFKGDEILVKETVLMDVGQHKQVGIAKGMPTFRNAFFEPYQFDDLTFYRGPDKITIASDFTDSTDRIFVSQIFPNNASKLRYSVQYTLLNRIKTKESAAIASLVLTDGLSDLRQGISGRLFLGTDFKDRYVVEVFTLKEEIPQPLDLSQSSIESSAGKELKFLIRQTLPPTERVFLILRQDKLEKVLEH